MCCMQSRQLLLDELKTDMIGGPDVTWLPELLGRGVQRAVPDINYWLTVSVHCSSVSPDIVTSYFSACETLGGPSLVLYFSNLSHIGSPSPPRGILLQCVWMCAIFTAWDITLKIFIISSPQLHLYSNSPITVFHVSTSVPSLNHRCKFYRAPRDLRTMFLIHFCCVIGQFVKPSSCFVFGPESTLSVRSSPLLW